MPGGVPISEFLALVIVRGSLVMDMEKYLGILGNYLRGNNVPPMQDSPQQFITRDSRAFARLSSFGSGSAHAARTHSSRIGFRL